MAGMDDFRKNIGKMVSQAKAEAEKREAEMEQLEERTEKMLLEFDDHADRLQEQIVEPRVRYLAGLFAHATDPESAEETDYRHRIHVHFNHVDEFPCTADVTVLIVHDKEPGFFNVKFEYVILPTYVTDRYKLNESLRARLAESSDGMVAAFIEQNIQVFLTHYLRAQKA